jgi:hypothetical protein
MPTDSLTLNGHATPQPCAPVNIDFNVSSEGHSLVLFLPVSEDADDFAHTMFASAMKWGGCYVVETRYADAILRDLIDNHGFVCRIDGNVVTPGGN